MKNYILFYLCTLFFVSISVGNDTTLNKNRNHAGYCISLFNAVESIKKDGEIKPDKDALFILKFIEKNLAVSIPYPSNNFEINLQPLNSSNVIWFRRFYDTSIYIPQKTYLMYKKKADSLFIESLYCKQYGLPKNYLKEIESMSKRDGYYTTHASLYLETAKRNKCFVSNNSEFKKIKMKTDSALYKFATRPKSYYYDEDIEAFAVMSYLGMPVERKWIDKIIEFQKEDGGWRAMDYLEETNAHTTTLSIWVLVANLANSKMKNEYDLNLLDETEQYIAWHWFSKLEKEVVLTNHDKLFFIEKQNNKKEYGGLGLNFINKSVILEQMHKDSIPFASIQTLLIDKQALAYFLHSAEKKNGIVFIKNNKEKYLNDLENLDDELKRENLLHYLFLMKLFKGNEFAKKDVDAIITSAKKNTISYYNSMIDFL